MAIVIRFSDVEHVLRSTGENPGIIGCGVPFPDSGFTLYAAPQWEPDAKMKAAYRAAAAAGVSGVVSDVRFDQGRNDGLVPLDADAVIAGCVGELEVTAVMRIVIAMLNVVVEQVLVSKSLMFEELAAAAAYAAQVRCLLTVRLQAEGWA